ncbi:hypothetical protein BU23DRAFT_577525 [Bimuria novae-zelandiae CBS 107.79]|uniref:RING-CH-type domain-containing protein n=1 Tax=Bimuria novae-zelandiae CBS 107.79 TaxID=1447943 RepID=A0A6A5VXZ3_9PLEO|nr:hypothetical protein BU23DRAFT_577525 [Bimuria novae-zelandiae CBS 107.79]
MASTSGYEHVPGWYWPDDVPGDGTLEGPSSARQRAPPRTSSTTDGPMPKAEPSGNTPKQRHWRPRQCRICLDTVNPTFDVPSENLPSFLQSTGNVKYEDENGRLIRPCMCKGSAKYVHEGCLQAWRHADPSYGRRNYWQCPICKFKYRLARLGAGRFVGSIAAQIILTIAILIAVVFLLGFVADPIINLYVDPWSFLMPWSTSSYDYYMDEDRVTWSKHFAKGLASTGVLGFLKVLLASPLQIFRIGGGRGRATARDRYEQVSWVIILIGVGTFLAAIYKGVRAWSRRTLEKAGERVMDVQGDDDDEE